MFIIHKIRQKPRDTREQLGAPHEYSQKGITRCASTHRHCYNTATTELVSAHTGCTYSMCGNLVDLCGISRIFSIWCSNARSFSSRVPPDGGRKRKRLSVVWPRSWRVAATPVGAVQTGRPPIAVWNAHSALPALIFPSQALVGVSVHGVSKAKTVQHYEMSMKYNPPPPPPPP